MTNAAIVGGQSDKGSRASALVVTPYHRESRAVLERCIRSVASQSVAVDHVLVADGHPADWIDALPVRHVRLDRAHGDHGNTPRAIGLLLGVAEGYGGIALLDADNWFEDDHIAACLEAAARDPGCDYVVARRRFVRSDGTTMLIAEEPAGSHVDTSCFFFLAGSYAVLPLWGTMPGPLSPICDRIFYSALKARSLRAAGTDRVTVNFQVTVRDFYAALGEAPPAEAKDGPDMAAMRRWLDSLDDAALAAASLRAGVRLLRSGAP